MNDKQITQAIASAYASMYQPKEEPAQEVVEEAPEVEQPSQDLEESLSGTINKKLSKDKKDQEDAKAKVKAKGGVIGKKGSGVSMKEEELDEATKTFKSLEDWLMAVLAIPGASVSKMGNNLRANGLGRTQSATFELKKGRGSLLEAKLDPVGKEDGDIDNDGDTDESDKYLAKRRKTISKALEKKKAKTEAKEECPKCEGEGCDHCEGKGYHESCGSKKKTMSEVEQPRAKGEKDFKDKHVIKKTVEGE